MFTSLLVCLLQLACYASDARVEIARVMMLILVIIMNLWIYEYYNTINNDNIILAKILIYQY